jgi:hypothetical protein
MPTMTLQEGQRVRHVEDRINGTVVLTGTSKARVEFDNGTQVVFDREDDKHLMLLDQLMLDMSGWARLGEVDTFAKSRKIGRAEAIKRLVYAGLGKQ